jgi:hypothetical protein
MIAEKSFSCENEQWRYIRACSILLPIGDMALSNAAIYQRLANAASYCIEAVRDERVELCIQLTCSQHTGSSHAS